mmetsp:Transcript_31668/g.95724  ORF Transcript_31668/g.95724 Transcript_31668/m.95724 type:complete len:247 (+) Transcript_31668:257-997(+)
MPRLQGDHEAPAEGLRGVGEGGIRPRSAFPRGPEEGRRRLGRGDADLHAGGGEAEQEGHQEGARKEGEGRGRQGGQRREAAGGPGEETQEGHQGGRQARRGDRGRRRHGRLAVLLHGHGPPGRRLGPAGRVHEGHEREVRPGRGGAKGWVGPHRQNGVLSRHGAARDRRVRARGEAIGVGVRGVVAEGLVVLPRGQSAQHGEGLLRGPDPCGRGQGRVSAEDPGGADPGGEQLPPRQGALPRQRQR